MMEYLILTSVFLLGAGGLIYLDGKFTRLFSGPVPGETPGVYTQENTNLKPADAVVSRDLNGYGTAGGAFSTQTRKSLKVIAAPLP